VSKVMCHYFSTKNRVSPFVMMINDSSDSWKDGSNMVKTVLAGKKLGCRPAIQAEIDLVKRSYRYAAITWQTVREMLWTHRSEDLEMFYAGIAASIRKNSDHIKQNLQVVQGKILERQKERHKMAVIVKENRRREAAKNPQLTLFEVA